MPQCLARGLPCSEFILFNRRLVISQGRFFGFIKNRNFLKKKKIVTNVRYA